MFFILVSKISEIIILISLYLPNRNIDEIDLSNELNNKPILAGTFNFI